MSNVINCKPAVVIHSCDKYSWILPEFFSYFNKNFPFELEWPIYFCNEEVDVITTLYNRKHIKAGTGSWSARLKYILENIEEKDILYIQEDFFLQYCNTEWLQMTANLHGSIKSNITKLGSNYEFTLEGPFTHDFFNKIDCELPIYLQRSGLYMMSHQPVALFNKEFLLSTLTEDCGPSEHEINTSKKMQNMEKPPICIGQVFCPNKSQIFTIHHAVYKGVYCPIK